MDDVVHRLGCDHTINSESHLHQETKMVTGNVWMRTTDYLSLFEPFLTDGSKNSERFHGGLGVEDVVNDSLELKGVVCVWHQLGRVGTGHVEDVCELLIVFAVAQHLQKTIFVSNMFELRMSCANSSR